MVFAIVFHIGFLGNRIIIFRRRSSNHTKGKHYKKFHFGISIYRSIDIN